MTRQDYPGKLVSAVGVILAARLSPERDAEDGPEILLPTDGPEPRNVTQPPADDGAPACSPAGSSVAHGKSYLAVPVERASPGYPAEDIF